MTRESGEAELSRFAQCMERPECLIGFGIGLEIVGLLWTF
jgi:hypothetical protein